MAFGSFYVLEYALQNHRVFTIKQPMDAGVWLMWPLTLFSLSSLADVWELDLWDSRLYCAGVHRYAQGVWCTCWTLLSIALHNPSNPHEFITAAHVPDRMQACGTHVN